MKRFQKALLGVVVSGALLFSAQAAELSSSAQDTLQSAMTKVQQEIKDYGQFENTRLLPVKTVKLSSRTSTRNSIWLT